MEHDADGIDSRLDSASGDDSDAGGVEVPEEVAGKRGRGRPKGKAKSASKTKPEPSPKARSHPNTKKFCRGCLSYLSLDKFPVNQGLDYECKHARDSLYKMAIRQNELEWFAELESDRDRFAQLIKVFKAQSKQSKDEGR